MLPEEVISLGSIESDAASVGVVGLKETKPLSIKCALQIRIRLINDLGYVREWILAKVIPAPGECTVDKPSRGERPIVTNGPVARTIVPLGVYCLV